MSPLSSFPWQRSIDIRSLVVFRVGLGLFLCFDVVARLLPWPVSLGWYTRDGMLQSQDSPHGNWIHRLWFARTSAATQCFLFGVTFLLAFLLAAGVTLSRWPRATVAGQVLLWILVVGMQNRCMFVHTGGDNFTRQMLLWLILLPVSVQQEMQCIFRGSKRSFSREDAVWNSNSVTNLATTGLLLQITIMYAGTVARRTVDSGFRYGDWLPPELSAVWFVLRDAFAVREQWYVDFLRTIKFPWTQVMTALSILVECSPVLLLLSPNTAEYSVRGASEHWMRSLPPARWIGFLLLASLHGGLFLVMRLPNWQCIAILANVLWIPTVTWDRIWPSPVASEYKKTDNPQHLSSAGTIATKIAGTESIGRRVLTWFFLGYMMYNFAGERRWIAKHDGGDIGEFFRISQFWVMYERAPRMGRLTSVVGKNDEQWVDVFRGLRTGTWDWQSQASLESSELQHFVSPRWERAFSKFSERKDKKRATKLLQFLCRHVPSPVHSLELRWEYYRIKPPTEQGRWTFEYEIPIRVYCH